jgi:hypothetical protein
VHHGGVTAWQIVLAVLALWCAGSVLLAVLVARVLARGSELLELEHLWSLPSAPGRTLPR